MNIYFVMSIFVIGIIVLWVLRRSGTEHYTPDYSIFGKAQYFDRYYGEAVYPDVDISRGENSPFDNEEDDLYPDTAKPRTSFEEIEKENALNNINAQLLNDVTFRDVVYYENEENGRLGLDRCLDNKTGYCVEYGQTGNAWYYPANLPYDTYGNIMNETLTPEERSQPIIGTISYPNLR